MNDVKPFLNPANPLNFGHRGFAAKFPENTLLSFQEAIEAGADVLELDVHLSMDDHLIIIHDETVNRTTNGNGLVRKKTISELKKLDAAYHYKNNDKNAYPFRNLQIKISTLSELFAEIPHIKFNIDIKQHDKKTCEILLGTIREFKMENQVLAVSSDYDTISYFRKISQNQIATGASSKEIKKFLFGDNLPFWKCNFEADALQVPEWYYGFKIVTKNFIRKAHNKNIAVHAWTVNEEDSIKDLLILGIDGIMTDYPDVLRKTISKHKSHFHP